MTPEEADQRIIQSRRVLAGWKVAARYDVGVDDLLRIIGEELETLQQIAKVIPGKAHKLENLCGEWRAYQSFVMGKAN